MFMAKSQLSRTAKSILSAIYVTDQMLEFMLSTTNISTLYHAVNFYLYLQWV